MRALVAIAPIRGTHWSGLRGLACAPFVIDDEAMTTVSVRLLAELVDGVWLPGSPTPRSPGLFVDSLPRMDDVVPVKGRADVLVSFEGVPQLRERNVVVHVASAAIEVDPSARVEESPPWNEGQRVVIERDIELLQRAPAAHRAPAPRPNEPIGWDIDGQSAALGTLGFGVALRADFRDGRRTMLPLIPTTLGISIANRTLELTFRALVVDPSFGLGLDRVVVGVSPSTGSPDEHSDLLDAALARSSFAFAATAEDALHGARPPVLEGEELDVARLEAWEAGPAEPSIDPDEYHAVVTELAQRPRAEVLRDHGFDEISWGCEEWAVAELIARRSLDSASAADEASDAEPPNDPELAAWVAASRPSLGDRPPPDLDAYARLTAHLAHRDPAKVLEEAGLTPAELVAIEEHMQAHLDANEANAHRFESLLARYDEEASAAAEAELSGLMEET